MRRKERSMYKRFTTPDKTEVVSFEGKLHCWDGPALIPQGNKKLAEYYIYGFQYTEAEWKAAKRDHTGLPWYKLMGSKARF